ncbi:MAG TPA: histidine phosphatase family protein [Aggregatilineaceae bacterium]|nr:histidine phosphatase family protein [Aggregatilineaceae bacterium]
MTHLYLIRHADYLYDRVDGQGPRRDQGLTPEGVHQATRLRDRLASSGEIKPDVFISSTERSAHETAQILQPAFNQPIILDEAMEEWRSEDGSLSDEEFMARWQQVPKSQKGYYRWVEGGENRMEFVLRVHLALNRILQDNQGQTIVIVTHGAVIQTSFVFFFGYGEASLERALLEINRTSITHWYQQQDRWVLERSNDTHHLGPTL